MIEIADTGGRPAGRVLAEIDALSPGAVAIEVAADERLRAGRVVADIGAAGPLAVLEFPDVDVAVGRIEPEQVKVAVMIVVPRAISRIPPGSFAKGEMPHEACATWKARAAKCLAPARPM